MPESKNPDLIAQYHQTSRLFAGAAMTAVNGEKQGVLSITPELSVVVGAGRYPGETYIDILNHSEAETEISERLATRKSGAVDMIDIGGSYIDPYDRPKEEVEALVSLLKRARGLLNQLINS